MRQYPQIVHEIFSNVHSPHAIEHIAPKVKSATPHIVAQSKKQFQPPSTASAMSLPLNCNNSSLIS